MFMQRIRARAAERFSTTVSNTVRGADFVSKAPRFFFETADGELGAGAAVAEIFPNPRFEAATSFALSDVHELMEDQLAIAPAISPNDDAMTDGYATRSIGNDLGVPRGLSQRLIIGQRNPIDDQHSDTGTILNADPTCVGRMLWPQRRPAGEYELLLRFRPLNS